MKAETIEMLRESDISMVGDRGSMLGKVPLHGRNSAGLKRLESPFDQVA